VRAAQAVEAALLQQSATVRTLDLWSLMNPGAASIIQKTYLRLVQEYPELYERLYHLDEHTWRHIFQSEEGPPAAVLEVLELISEILFNSVADARGSHYASDRLLLSLLGIALPYDGASLAGVGVRARLALIKWAWLRLNKRIGGLVQQFAPEVIVSTQMIPAAMVSSLKRRGRLSVPLMGVLTDYGMHDFWRQPGVDCYCIAHDSIAAAVQERGRADVQATGVPLMPGFAHPLSQQEARRQLNIGSHSKVILVLGGGLGLSVDAIAAQLLQRAAPMFLLAMPGKNSTARSQLLARAAHHPGCMQVCDWTERMDIYIRAADVVVGKPGGVSVAEVLACGRPLFATRSLGGQEGFNVRFLEQHGVGGLVADAELADRIDAVIHRPDELVQVQERAWALGSRDGAMRISDLALDLAWAHRPQNAIQEY
jgi:UDP-N-acetylglucosamine:LPS N-acetylglucosamine transferase